MSGTHLSQRKPYETSPYASLQTSDDAVASEQKVATRTAAVVDPWLVKEAEKLAQLRAALWSAFMAAPETGLPTDLIDLTIAYTNALRLELTLMGFNRLPAARASGGGPPLGLKERR